VAIADEIVVNVVTSRKEVFLTRYYISTMEDSCVFWKKALSFCNKSKQAHVFAMLPHVEESLRLLHR
tara:strand:- start:440 stop:640 length:201 start_codon:yes stop_codon:yes gene_type:complete